MNNPKGLREIDRVIAAAVVLSQDGKILMGKKDPKKGGVYPNAWHIPGGGLEPGETLDEGLVREVGQEVVGLDLSGSSKRALPIHYGETTRRLEGGEEVWCRMEFNVFEVKLDKSSAQLAKELSPGDDLVELRWFGRDELKVVEQIPGGRELFLSEGYI